ncbi:MAG: L-serine ammonia-lyase [Chromatiaceae bacterium]|jgi:L-serine dehydratase
MFISALELFKIGIGPSSSHTMGPMRAACRFIELTRASTLPSMPDDAWRLQCTLKGSLAYTGRGHGTDRAVILGLNGYLPAELAGLDVEELLHRLCRDHQLDIGGGSIGFSPGRDIVFDRGAPLPEHSNGLVFELFDRSGRVMLSEVFFSIGGGFVSTRNELAGLVAPLKMEAAADFPFGFASARSMLQMAADSGLSIAAMKRHNELEVLTADALDTGLDSIWAAMRRCVDSGLTAEGDLPGGLHLRRRARALHQQLEVGAKGTTVNDWLCAYAMAVNEENAAGHMVVTAPTNGAAGIIPAVLYYLAEHEGGTPDQVRDFLLTASAIGGIIKHNSSISGAEVGCQGEVGSAASMAAAGLCAVRGGTPRQIENAAEIALEHHLGMTCDPVNGLVQVPCIERNGFGAIKAYAAASLAMRESGEHFMPLDNCIAAMKQTGLEMSEKYKETSQGGLAVSITEC